MPTNKWTYSAETAITCGLDAVANSASRQSASIDNTSNLYLDALVSAQFKTTSGSLATAPVIYIYAYGWSYGQSTDFTDNATGSDASYTLLSPTNLKLIGTVAYSVASNTTLYCGPWSIALAFGGILPGKWGIVVNNQTGLALAGSANAQVSNTLSFVGVSVTSS